MSDRIYEINSGPRWIPFTEASPPADRVVDLAQFPIEANCYGPWIGIGKFDIPEARNGATHWRFRPELIDAPDPRDALIRELTEALKPFAVMSEAYRAYVAPDDTELCRMAGMICDRTTIGDLRRARSLVAKVEGKS